MYKNIIFDMDGTLVNTYEGIFNSYQYAITKMGLDFGGDEFVKKVIGTPLKKVFLEEIGLSEEAATEAVKIYRTYYQEKGKKEACLYNGMAEVLKALKERGCKICIATLKKEQFAKEIVEDMGIAEFFDVVYGIDEKDSYTKANLILKCIEYVKGEKKDSILIGDSEYDFLGAKEVGIDFMAVTYGFGFKENLKNNEIKFIATECMEILKSV